MKNSDNIISEIKRGIKRIEVRLKNTVEAQEGRHKLNDLTYHAGYDKGYWQGKLAGLTQILDLIQEEVG